jgi:hypothetical protein
MSKEMENTWFFATHKACVTVVSGGCGPSFLDLIWFSVFHSFDLLKKQLAGR